MTAVDPFDDLLDLENGFYREGFDAGLVDSSYAGFVEGKVFGMEKGYEKALELGKLHGRALVWNERLKKPRPVAGAALKNPIDDPVYDILQGLPPLPDNIRLRKNAESLFAFTAFETLPKQNTDTSVTFVDECIIKSTAKAKIIAQSVTEFLKPESSSASAIEESYGLSARR